MQDTQLIDVEESFDIAIIGMAGRFPGANTIEAFWRNLREGVESIASFTDQELLALDVDPQALSHPQFVKAGAILDRVDHFDAAFFGYSPREAELMDPQHRIFLECASEALENAGYSSERYEGLIAVYAGMSMSTYLLFNLLANPSATSIEDNFQVMLGTDKDFLSTRVSYKLNLKGPSIDVQTGCSTSLVAVHLACQSLLSYQCDMALTGGISVNVPQRTGYYYQEGGIASPDGHCRAFDADGQGTIFGSGAGVVVLKRLSDALADGDQIVAVIKGSAINNDGSSKVGYTAPSIEGQAEVIARAQAMAGVSPATISYIETHGTGTALGDPAEIAALTNVFRAGTDAESFCGLGSVKTNIGHLDAAAGVAGLIKTVLALKHQQIPPSLHFENPNPRIDWLNSPFYVNNKLTPWVTGDTPRRAGVSSFGIGGTNAHVILEEAPPVEATTESRPWQLLLLSAKTASALEAMTANLATYLRQQPEVALADVAYTLQIGRKTFDYRRMILCQDREDALQALETLNPQRVVTVQQEASDQRIVFMFPGGGSQYVDMGRDLYHSEATFREQVDACCELLIPMLGYDLRTLLYPQQERASEIAEQFTRTSIALPALFVVEYALAQQWITWGVQPSALIGHSLGEYVAACLAGVFSLKDALALVVLRGQLFEDLPRGAMLSVSLAADNVQELLPERLSLAAINAPESCVVAGSIEHIEDLAERLADQEIEVRRLHIDVAAHSTMVEPVLAAFTRFVERLHLNPPAIPFISNVTGTWITEGQATNPSYWASHLRQTVRFSDGVQALLSDPGNLLLEVGPGQTLGALAKLHLDPGQPRLVLPSIRQIYDQKSDLAFLLNTLGRLWLADVVVDWSSFYAGALQPERRQRCPLPTYPFERQRYWIEPSAQPLTEVRQVLPGKRPNIDDWFYLPGWKHALLPKQTEIAVTESQRYLIFVDPGEIGVDIAERLVQAGHMVSTVRTGSRFSETSSCQYTISPGRRSDYDALIQALQNSDRLPRRIIHLWSMAAPSGQQSGRDGFQAAQDHGYFSLIFLAQALADHDITEQLRLWVVSTNIQAVGSDDRVCPEQATLLAPCKVIPQEYPHIACRHIDVVAPRNAVQKERLVNQLLAEERAAASDPIVAYRGHQRWVETFEPVPLNSGIEAARPLREKGVYLITGGLGTIGLLLAEHLAQTVQARLVLTGRSDFPDREQWPRWLETHGDADAIGRKIRRLQTLETSGAEVLVVRADVTNQVQMQEVINHTYERFGALHGVIHTAGLAGEKAVNLLTGTDPATSEPHFAGKVYGLYVLEQVLQGRDVDFCLLFSSNAAVLGGVGLTSYTAANLFMDAFAHSRNAANEIHWLSANWDGWLSADEPPASIQTSIDQFAMTATESLTAFDAVVSTTDTGQIVVSTGDLESRLRQWTRQTDAMSALSTQQNGESVLHPRPAIEAEYIAPTSELEQTVVNIWQELLGIEQVGLNDNFFDLGGNSLIGLKVISRLKKELRIDISVTALFEGPTVSALTQVIKQDETSHNATFEERQSRGTRRRDMIQRKRQAPERDQKPS